MKRLVISAHLPKTATTRQFPDCDANGMTTATTRTLAFYLSDWFLAFVSKEHMFAIPATLAASTHFPAVGHLQHSMRKLLFEDRWIAFALNFFNEPLYIVRAVPVFQNSLIDCCNNVALPFLALNTALVAFAAAHAVYVIALPNAPLMAENLLLIQQSLTTRPLVAFSNMGKFSSAMTAATTGVTRYFSKAQAILDVRLCDKDAEAAGFFVTNSLLPGATTPKHLTTPVNFDASAPTAGKASLRDFRDFGVATLATVLNSAARVATAKQSANSLFAIALAVAH